MTSQATRESDGATLVAEIERYLAAVETFRTEGREPTWLAETTSHPAAVSRRRRTKARAS
jgi:hypothetical protein